MKFLIVIGNNALYTYECSGQQFIIQYIEGSVEFNISVVNIREDVTNFMEVLANEKNLGTIAKLEFDVLEGTEANLNKAIINALEGHVEKVYDLEETLKKILVKLQRDKKLMIDTYGINYNGYSYKCSGNGLKHDEYDLLAYTIHSDDVVSLMNK